MAVVSGITSACKQALWNGVHQPGDVYKLALYDEGASLSPMTDVYTTQNECKGKGYSAGGVELTGRAVTLVGNKSMIGWSEALIRNATISSSCGLIYNASKSNTTVGVIDFEEVVRSTNGNFKVPLNELFWIG